ncbi:MAG: hypothetical protein EBY63_07370, partial [Flavobacteriia bacterium]|nr:hypothetical protein [Flavobacteriia bacterium]
MHTENKTNTVSLSVSTWVFMAFFMLSPICAAEKMDILFIAIDDMNDWTTVFDKNNPIQTPNLERLAARGAQPPAHTLNDPTRPIYHLVSQDK